MSTNYPTIIPQTDPRAGYLAHKSEIDEAIARVLESGQYILGRETAAFEREVAAYFDVSHAIGVASGTNALEIALRACGIGLGDAVVTVSHTAVATVAAIELAGATPVFVDIDPKTFNIDPNSLGDAIKKHVSGLGATAKGRLKAIIPVHLYGNPADMPAVMDIAEAYDLYVIEDCAQAHGAAIQGHKVGGWGHMAAFSFYPTKNLGAFGDGGMVVTDDPELAERSRMLREYGWRERYVSSITGTNSRLDELQAAILRVKLHHLDVNNERRQALAQVYQTRLTGSDLTLPSERPACYHAYHLYVIRCKERDRLRLALREQGIDTGIHYPLPVHQQPAYAKRLDVPYPLTHTEQVSREVLSLPLYPELPLSDATRTADRIMAWYRDN